MEPHSLRETREAVREQHGVAWIGLYRPTEEEFAAVDEEFNLHPLAVEDAIKAHQRPKLSREVIEFQRAIGPLAGVLEDLIEDERLEIDSEVRRYLRDVRDHALRVTEKAEGFRELLNNILDVNLTLVGIRQNDEVKRISAWARSCSPPRLWQGSTG